MKSSKIFKVWCMLFVPVFFFGCQRETTNIERPEKIVSMRQVIYDKETYSNLADLWQKYYDEFPSEDAYANWMYAARYAGLPDYEENLETGLSRFSSNPTLLYLTALIKHGKADNLEAIHLLEKAVELDPGYFDPWFALVTDYMGSGELEKMDVALRKLLELGAISEEVMDYNYNVITLLQKDAILITNGDNDTYPAWILAHILKYRPDVRIVNRSLLNTDWYPKYITNEGVPEFITQENLEKLKKNMVDKLKAGQIQMPPAGLVSDLLLENIISTAERANRPVYLSATLYQTETVERFKNSGRNLGLVTIVNSNGKNYSTQIKKLVDGWLNDFRIFGLQSWKIRYGKEPQAGKTMMINYAAAIHSLMGEIIKYAPESRLKLFQWYRENLVDLFESSKMEKYNAAWCKSKDIKVISDWCKSKNYLE